VSSFDAIAVQNGLTQRASQKAYNGKDSHLSPAFFAAKRIAAIVIIICLAFMGRAGAQGAATAIVGTVTDVASGLAVSNASVSLYRGTSAVAKSVTDQNGSFRFPNQSAAVYRVEVRASGFGAALSDDIAVAAGATQASVNIALSRQSGSQRDSLRTIGRTSASSTLGGGLQRTSTVSQDITTELLSREGFVNIGEGITTLPGVNNTGHSSTVGDDTSISLRGFDPSESQTLLDGHPIGPIGVGGGGYNYQVSPFYALRNTQVTFGAGALGLYGTDATGGAIDLQTLSPTRTREIALTQGFGSQGKLFSALTATGTTGKLGYAVAGATQGLYGNFAPQQILQSGNLGFDTSPSNLAANTHLVSGNYSLRDALLKFEYTLAPGTVATITGYTAHSRDDKSGVGDNDYQPYDLAVANAQGNLGTGGCAATLVPVKISDAGAVRCETPAEAAKTSYGPSGGGPNPFQDIVNQDYHGRLVTNYLGNQIEIDGYVDTYNLLYNRNQASQLPDGRYTGGFSQNLYKTNGFLISDDLPRGKNDFAFGYFTQHQTYDSNQFDTGNYVIVPNPKLFLATDSVFLRDTFSPAPWMTLYTNVYYKVLSTTGADTVDPRATLLLRPTPKDVIRLVAGKTDGEPSANLASTQLNNTPSNINPNGACSSLVGLASNTTPTPGQIGVGRLASSNLQQETASDFELTYGHSFASGSQFQIAGYVQRAANLIQSLSVPVPNGLIPNGLLQQIYARIQTACGTAYVGTPQDLSLSQATNSTLSGLYRGIEFSGRLHATRTLSFDFTYDLQHAQVFGYSDADLAGNATAINGGQLAGIPLNKGSLGAEFDNRRGFDARVDGYYIGVNNGYHRPAYGFANASFQYAVPRTGSEIGLSINNLTNSAYQQYGLLDAGVPSAVNSFNNSTVAKTELFGLPPRTFTVTLTQRLH